MRLKDSLIKLLDGLIQVSNSLIKLSARNQEPRTKIPRKVAENLGSWNMGGRLIEGREF